MRRVFAGLTRRGRGFLLVGLVMSAAAMLLGQRDLLRVGMLLLVLPIISLVVVLRSRVRLAARRVVEPGRVTVSQPANVRLAMDNLARIPTGVLLLEDAVPYALGRRPRFVVDQVWSRWHREISYPVSSGNRGRYVIGPLSVRLTDPFGLVELMRSFTETSTLTVTPEVTQLTTPRLPGEWDGGGESRPRSIAAAGEEDVSVRPYQHGDDMRRVHWRATAHHGDLIVRREEQPWQSRATLLLDTRTAGHAGHGSDSSFEWAVSATASIGVHLLTRGYAVRLLTDAGSAVTGSWHDSSSGPGDAEGTILDALAVVSTRRDASLGRLPGLLSGSGSASGLFIAILGRLSPDEAAMVGRLRHGTAPALAIVIDSLSWAGQGALAEEQARHEAAMSTLRGAGWQVASAARGESVALVWERLLAAGSRSIVTTGGASTVSPLPAEDGAA